MHTWIVTVRVRVLSHLRALQSNALSAAPTLRDKSDGSRVTFRRLSCSTSRTRQSWCWATSRWTVSSEATSELLNRFRQSCEGLLFAFSNSFSCWPSTSCVYSSLYSILFFKWVFHCCSLRLRNLLVVSTHWKLGIHEKISCNTITNGLHRVVVEASNYDKILGRITHVNYQSFTLIMW